MYSLKRFEAVDAIGLVCQPQNVDAKDFYLCGDAHKIATIPGQYTICFNKKPVVIGGFVPIWDNRATVWTIFDQDLKGRFMRPILQRFHLLVESQPYLRLEAAVPHGTTATFLAIKRLKKLGFFVETYEAKEYFQGGRSAYLLTRLKKVV